MKDWTAIFSELGCRLEGFGSDDRSQAVIAQTMTANPWFDRDSILLAVRAIRERMLLPEELSAWRDNYTAWPSGHGLSLGIIMAGNIPLVGFHDLICGLACGYECRVKTSGKDSVLMSYVIDMLNDMSPYMNIKININNRPDVLIATGSDNTIRHLRSAYPYVKALFRGSRSSVAILSGAEDDRELRLLANDIFTYNGLGCRNVSLLFVPSGYDVGRAAGVFSGYGPVNPKYRNNYLQNKALSVMSGRGFIDGGFFTMHRSDDFPLYISDISYVYYDDPVQVDRWIAVHADQLQCVVSNSYTGYYCTKAGQAQFPGLTDYADRRDTVEFLCEAAKDGCSDWEKH